MQVRQVPLRQELGKITSANDAASSKDIESDTSKVQSLGLITAEKLVLTDII